MLTAQTPTATTHDIDHSVAQMYRLVGMGLWGLLPTHLRESLLADAAFGSAEDMRRTFRALQRHARILHGGYDPDLDVDDLAASPRGDLALTPSAARVRELEEEVALLAEQLEDARCELEQERIASEQLQRQLDEATADLEVAREGRVLEREVEISTTDTLRHRPPYAGLLHLARDCKTLKELMGATPGCIRAHKVSGATAVRAMNAVAETLGVPWGMAEDDVWEIGVEAWARAIFAVREKVGAVPAPEASPTKPTPALTVQAKAIDLASTELVKGWRKAPLQHASQLAGRVRSVLQWHKLGQFARAEALSKAAAELGLDVGERVTVEAFSRALVGGGGDA